MTTKKLAAHFEVLVRTILWDIDILSLTNIPVYTIQGRGGGTSIPDGCVLNKVALNEEEQKQTLIALRSLAATGNTDANRTLSKPSALFQKTDTDWLKVDFSRWGQGTQDNRRSELLKTATLRRHVICFDYVDPYGSENRRKAYPLKLVFELKAWYLQGYCLEKQVYRTSKINRMLHMQLTGERFPARQYSPPSIESTDAASLSLINLELEFSAQAAHRVYGEFDGDCIERNADGSYHVPARMLENGWFYSFLFSLGRGAKVLRPACVADYLEGIRNKTWRTTVMLSDVLQTREG